MHLSVTNRSYRGSHHMGRCGARRLAVEGLEPRRLLDGAVHAMDEGPELSPQYVVHHPPRLQLGNAPLIGTPAFDGLDQIELLWQTMTVNAEQTDTFEVEFRQVGQPAWTPAQLNAPHDNNFETRIMHSATLRELDWNTEYEYRVRHVVEGDPWQTYGDSFVTRLHPEDQASFSFATYGDSAAKGENGAGFRNVQSQINELDPDFALLLGDNFYTFGTQQDADARFHPDHNPAATQWNSGKIDYFAIGNHDALNLDGGQASRDNFSVPVPIAGVNAYASPPAGEFPEHNYSFDYGDVHFVTFDSNTVELLTDPELISQRLKAQVDYVIADLEASAARWKIVFVHHPLLGTEKTTDEPSGEYFQTVMPRLKQAGVDLFLSAHSHTYAWTYPLTGFADDDGNGQITADEVEYVERGRQVFRKGEGLVQLVAGTGGRSIRHHTYPDPFIARGYSQAADTGPASDGFAHVQITPDRLTVSYLSGNDGSIVGDDNGNGRRDASEAFFGQFVIVTTDQAAGEFTGDQSVDARDVNALCQAVRSNAAPMHFDLDGDGTVDLDDLDYMIRFILESDIGDADLNGRVDSSDLVAIFQAGQYADSIAGNSGWTEGDFDCDAESDTSDLVRMFRAGSYIADSAPAMLSRATLAEIAAALADDANNMPFVT